MAAGTRRRRGHKRVRTEEGMGQAEVQAGRKKGEANG